MNPLTEYDEASILLQVAEGREEAFAVLFHHHRHRIVYFAWKFLQSESKAQDVLQEIFLKVWTSREQLPSLQNFKAWLTSITRNHIYNAMRRLALEEAFIREETVRVAAQGTATLLDELSFNELQRELQKAVAHLTPQQKKVFELSRVEGLRHDQIAERLHISRETVKKHMTDALRHIRGRINAPESVVSLGILVLTIRL